MIVNARKPDVFTNTMSLYEVVTEDGLMRPSYSLKRGGVYCGGSGACGGFCWHAACCPAAAQGPLTAFLLPAYAHLPCLLSSFLPALQLPWWRRLWGWQATPSFMWATTSVSSTAHSSTAMHPQPCVGKHGWRDTLLAGAWQGAAAHLALPLAEPCGDPLR